jgi:hypothetical protein
VKLFQNLGGLKYILQDVRKIKIDVDIRLDLLLLLDQKMKCYNFDLLIIL